MRMILNVTNSLHVKKSITLMNIAGIKSEKN